MSIKTVKYTISGYHECNNCDCRDAYICLSPSASVTLDTGGDVMPAEISETGIKIQEISKVIEKDAFCNTVEKGVYYPFTELTLKYDSDLFVDNTDELSELDIACVSIDGCAVKASAL